METGSSASISSLAKRWAMLVGGAQPLSALHLLWINLVSDIVPALALGMEPAEPGVMRQPPPVPGAPLLSRDALVTTGVDAAVMAATTLGAFGFALRRSGDSLAGEDDAVPEGRHQARRRIPNPWVQSS